MPQSPDTSPAARAAIAAALARGPRHWVAFVDGLCEPRNPGGLIVWAWVLTARGAEDSLTGVVAAAPHNTNNRAEVMGLGGALRAAHRAAEEDPAATPETLTVFTDSQLIANQLNGLWAVRDAYLAACYARCREIVAGIESLRPPPPGWLTVQWIPRQLNARADELCRRRYAQATGREPPDRSK